jgi:hypothetical protein
LGVCATEKKPWVFFSVACRRGDLSVVDLSFAPLRPESRFT